MKTIFHPANERGHHDHGWLNTYHSFSFAQYYDPEKIHFGALRVINDDYVAKKMGFGRHPHDNMEIITIILSGELEHQDSMGNRGIIKKGEVQVMSAGSGIMHSEFNPSQTEAVNLLQIWVFPSERDIEPRYDQKSFTDALKLNQLTTLISPEKTGDALWINQDARFVMGEFEAGQEVKYDIKSEGNGAYVFVIEGDVEIDGQKLGRRDALGISDTAGFTVSTHSKTHLLIIEVPMY